MTPRDGDVVSMYRFNYDVNKNLLLFSTWQDWALGAWGQLCPASAHGTVPTSQLANLREPSCPLSPPPPELLLCLGVGSFWAPITDRWAELVTTPLSGHPSQWFSSCSMQQNLGLVKT